MVQVQSRQGNFAAGSQGPMETSSLQASAVKQNARPKGFTPNGTNQPIGIAPGNGNGPVDAMRQEPGQNAPNTKQIRGANGIAPDTLAKLQPSYAQSVVN